MAASESLLPTATPSSSHSYFNSSLSSLLENFPPSSSSSSSSSSMTSSSFLQHQQQQPPISVSSISALMVPSTSPFVSEQQPMVTKSGLSTESMFSCSICHKRYSTEKYLQMHLALHKDITSPLTFSGANASGCKKFDRHFISDFQDQRTLPRNSSQHNRFASHHYKKQHQAIQKRTNFFPPPRHQSIEKIRNQCHYQFLSPPKLLPPAFNNQSQHQQLQHFQCSQSYSSNVFAFDRSNQFLPTMPLAEEDNFRNSATKYNFLALSGGQSNMYSSGACYNSYDECPHYADQSASNLAQCAGMNSSGTNVPTSNRSAASQRFQKASQPFTSLQQSAHLATQIWTCAYCSKTFTQSSNYKNHVRTHSDERPYVCELCSIGFKERYHLKKHLLFKHSTEAKEECRFCGKRFKDSTAVRAHERIHSDQRPYSCQRCRKAFKTSECLWHHENRSRTCGKALDNLRTEGATSKTCSASNSKNNIIPFSQNSADQQVRQSKKNQTIQRKINGGTKKKNNSLLLQTKPATHREMLSPVPSKDFQPKDDRSDCIVKVENDGYSYSSNFGISCDLQSSENGTFGSSSRMLYKNAQHSLALRSTPFQESFQNNEMSNAYRDDHPTYTQLRPLNLYGKNLTTFDISRDKGDDISNQLHACENFEKFDSKYANFNPNTSQNFDSNQTCPQFSERNIPSKASSCRMLENSKFNEEVMLGSPNVINQISKTDICDSSINDNKALFLSCIEESKTRFTKSMATTSSPDGGVRWQQDPARYNCLDETQYQRYDSPRNYANQDYRLMQQTCSFDGHIESNHSRHFQHGNQAYHHQYSPFYSHHHHQHLLLPTAIVAPIKRPNETMNDSGNLSSISLSSDQSIHPSFFTSTSSFTNMMTSNVDDKNVYQLQSQSEDFIDESNMADATSSSNQELGRVYYDKTQEINSSNGNPTTDHLDLKSLPPFETFVPATKSPTPHQQATLVDIGDYDSTASSLMNLDQKDQQSNSRQDLLSDLNSDEGFQQMEDYNAFQTD